MKSINKALPLLLFFFSLASASAQSWQPQAVDVLPADYGLFAISVVDENVVWGTGFDYTDGQPSSNAIPHVIKTTDGGANWTDYAVPEAMGRWSFDIVGIDANTAWISSIDLGNGSGQGLFKTDDGGETWTEKHPGPQGGVWIRFFDAQEGICINRQEMARTTDGGDTWEPVFPDNIPEFETDEYTIIQSGNNSLCAVGDRLYFGTNKGRVFRSKDRGVTWEVLDAGFDTDDVVFSVSFIDSLQGLAIAPQALNVKIARTRNGGETWEVFTTPAFGPYFQNIAYVTGTDSTFMGVSSNSSPLGSYYSTNFGKTWQTIDTDIPYRSVGFANPQIGWVSRGLIGPGQPAMYKWDDDLFIATVERPFHPAISIAPNPFRNELTLECEDAAMEYVSLFNASGILVDEASLGGQRAFRWLLPELPGGMYMVKIQTDRGASCEKLVRF